MNRKQSKQEYAKLPLVPLRGLVVFPNTVVTVDLGRERSLNALKKAMEEDGRLFLTAQRDSTLDHPSETDLYTTGTVVKIRQIAQQPDQVVRVLVEGLYRAILMEVLEAGEMQIAEVAAEESAAVKLTAERQASMRTALELCRQIVRERGAEMPELLSALEGEQDAGCFCDAAGAGML